MRRSIERLFFYLLVAGVAVLRPAKRLYPNSWTEYFGQLLNAAAYMGSLRSIRFLLWLYPDVEVREPLNRSTALMAASSGGRLEVVRHLLGRGADVNASNEYGETALMRCARTGDTDLALLLVESGTEINVRTKHGETAFLAAAKAGQTAMMTLLLGRGADMLTAGPGAMDALVWAAGLGKTETVEFLLDRGMSVAGKRGNLALQSAKRHENAQIISLLRRAGATDPA